MNDEKFLYTRVFHHSLVINLQTSFIYIPTTLSLLLS